MVGDRPLASTASLARSTKALLIPARAIGLFPFFRTVISMEVHVYKRLIM